MNSHELAKPELMDPQVMVDSDVNKVAGFKSMNLSDKPLIFPMWDIYWNSPLTTGMISPSA